MTPLIGSTVSRYKIVASLGAGGMGVVYEAEDADLGRQVAIKFISDDALASADALDRFQREAKAISSLNHPHICTIHDIGVHDGHPFLVMERLRGTTFQAALRKGPFATDRILHLGIQIGDALETAHRAGIIHRDLKPSNLFLTERGEAKILDFGLAKLASSSDPAAPTVAGDRGTAPGTAIGTVAYMSPEQARGETVDARSDLFSFGVVLYEMATGQLPFPGDSTADLFAALLRADPVPPSRLSPRLAPGLERVIMKVLEKDPALRYQSVADMSADLRRLFRDSTTAPPPARLRPVVWGIGVAVVVLAVGGSWAWLTKPSPVEADAAGTAAVAAKRLVVLPFENIGEPEDSYFADGMTDEVRSKLADLPGLAVIARASSIGLRTTARTPSDIARLLDVRFLVSATVRWQKSGDTSRIRLTPELIEIGGAGAPVTRWQQIFDAELADVFEVQSAIALEIAQALEVALGSTHATRVEQRPTSNIAAYDAYLRGREFFDRGFHASTQRDAAAKFEEAVALDPQFAVAWARLSLSRSMAYANGLPSPALGDAALLAAEKAMALAPRLPEGYFALGVYHRVVSRDRHRAVEILRQGLDIDPGNVDLLRNVGFAEGELGRLEASLAAMRQAATLDPQSWANQLSLASTFTLLHRPRDAREATKRGLALNPAQIDLIRHQVHSFLQEGDLAAARATAAAVPKEIEPTRLVADFAYYNHTWVLDDDQRDLLLRLTPAAFGGSRTEWALALAAEYWLRGDRVEARKHAEPARAGLAEQLADAPGNASSHSLLAIMLAILGDGEQAVQAAERAVALAPVDQSTDIGGAALFHLAVTYTRLDRPEPAIDALERLVKAPYRTTPGWLRVDPNFDPLRTHPRFQALVRSRD